jgi:phosphoenolpyruvate phosphomutase
VQTSGSWLLREAFTRPGHLRAGGAHDALSAVLVERNGYDAIWASGLGVSAAHAVPDASILTMTEFLEAARLMVQASNLPVIADCDTGFGSITNLLRMMDQYEAAGVGGVCIEDKEFPKRNSFRDGHHLADPVEFAAKVELAKTAQRDPDFMLIARTESLVAGNDVEDALWRAGLYADAGADAILIHSKAKSPDEVLEFGARWRALSRMVPLVIVPTTYQAPGCAKLEVNGIKLVIYANQALRAAIRAMDTTLGEIAADRPSTAEEDLLAVSDVLELIGTPEIEATELRFADTVERKRPVAKRAPKRSSRLQVSADQRHAAQ